MGKQRVKPLDTRGALRAADQARRLDSINQKINADGPDGPSTVDKFARKLTPGKLPRTQDDYDQDDSVKALTRDITVPLVHGRRGEKGWELSNPIISTFKSIVRGESFTPRADQMIRRALGEAGDSPFDRFMVDYHDMTQAHPFERGTRVHGGGDDIGLSEVRPFNKRIHVSWMQSANPQTKGIGTQMLTDLTGLADKHGVEMQLTPERPKGYSLPGPSTAQLKKWYGKHGFVKDTVDQSRMVRKPRTAQVEEEERDYGRGWMAPDGTFHKMLGWTTHSKWVEKNRHLIPDEHYGDLPDTLKGYDSWTPADAVDNMVKSGWVMKRSQNQSFKGHTETLFRAVDPGSPKVHAMIRDHLKSQGAKKGDIFRVQGMGYDLGDEHTYPVHEVRK